MKELIIALLFSSTLCTQAQQWTRWRGTDGLNHAAPISISGSSRMKIQWQQSIGEGHGMVLINHDRLYAMGSKISVTAGDTSYQDVIQCLDTADGRTVWEFRYACARQRNPGPKATPLLHQNRLYTLSSLGHLHCLNAHDGTLIWKRHLVDEGFSQVPSWGFTGSPLIHNGRLIINSGQWGAAFNPENGLVLWKSPAEKGGNGSPVFFRHEGRDLMAMMGCAVLNVVDPANGRLIWSREKNPETYSDPYIFEDKMLVTSYRPGCELLKITDSGPEAIWESSSTKTSSWQSLTIDGRYGYAPHSQQREHTIQCIDILSGEVMWSEPLGMWGALALAGDKLIVVTGDGEVVVAPASPEGFTALFRQRFTQLPPFQPGVREDVFWSHPVWTGGRLYVRSTGGQLFCLTFE